MVDGRAFFELPGAPQSMQLLLLIIIITITTILLLLWAYG